MEFYLPTRDECKEIVKNSEAFYCTETEVDGYQVEMYDYRLASINDFIDNKAFELRGLTFVYNEDTFTWDRHILLNKFFNVNQTIGWMLDDVKDKKIVRVQDKLDGSIISFVKFPDGKIKAKSKMSFTSPQAMMAQEVYNENKNIRSFIDTAFNDGYVPVFELVSPENQIVLEYDDTKLVLLQLRKNDGTYATKELMKSYKRLFELDMSQEYHLLHEDSDAYVNPLDWALTEKETKEGIEGWIVTFEDGQMAKIKTDWYLQLHGLVGPDAFRENLLIKTILDGNIDDVISQLVEGTKKDRIVELSEKVQHKFNHYVVEYKKLRGEYYNKYNENRKDFALQYSPGGKTPHELFSIVMRNLHGKMSEVEKIAESAIKEHILKVTSSLGDAKKFIENI